ncbi:hypothetical protein RJ640_017612 [Escallonia rubra]|uniref:Cyclin-like domain-containing protein n=1 Tax=Escallonia rubra TaxID=112253 RepID=A0AA88QVD8_9ASTE|nr:hypothetical protein RJ640_017612 [Escallonia rubra]
MAEKSSGKLFNCVHSFFSSAESKKLLILSPHLHANFFRFFITGFHFFSPRLLSLKQKIMEFELENPLTSFSQHQCDTIPSLFANETDHMPSSLAFKPGSFRAALRGEAFSLVLQAQFASNFDPYISYLAVNYMDRFVSKQEMPQQVKPWFLRLLVISCLSLAGKMKNVNLPLSDLQSDERFIYDTQSMHRMETLILTSLDWQMRSITPFSFLYYFISFLEQDYPSVFEALKDKASEILFKSQCDLQLLEFKPSIVAASALLSASEELIPLQFPCFRAQISSCKYVNKGSLLNCLGVIKEMAVDWFEPMSDAVSSGTKTPTSIL